LPYIVLVGLYEEPERPANAVDYIKRYMGAPAGVDVEAIRAEMEQLREDKKALQDTIKQLNDKVLSLHHNTQTNEQTKINIFIFFFFKINFFFFFFS
jgi:hypothetical protein